MFTTENININAAPAVVAGCSEYQHVLTPGDEVIDTSDCINNISNILTIKNNWFKSKFRENWTHNSPLSTNISTLVSAGLVPAKYLDALSGADIQCVADVTEYMETVFPAQKIVIVPLSDDLAVMYSSDKYAHVYLYFVGKYSHNVQQAVKYSIKYNKYYYNSQAIAASPSPFSMKCITRKGLPGGAKIKRRRSSKPDHSDSDPSDNTNSSSTPHSSSAQKAPRQKLPRQVQRVAKKDDRKRAHDRKTKDKESGIKQRLRKNNSKPKGYYAAQDGSAKKHKGKKSTKKKKDSDSDYESEDDVESDQDVESDDGNDADNDASGDDGSNDNNDSDRSDDDDSSSDDRSSTAGSEVDQESESDANDDDDIDQDQEEEEEEEEALDLSEHDDKTKSKKSKGKKSKDKKSQGSDKEEMDEESSPESTKNSKKNKNKNKNKKKQITKSDKSSKNTKKSKNKKSYYLYMFISVSLNIYIYNILLIYFNFCCISASQICIFSLIGRLNYCCIINNIINYIYI